MMGWNMFCLCASLCLILFLSNHIRPTDAAYLTLRKLNSKINLIRSGFQKEIDDLKYNVLDLSTELDIERYRNDELEGKLNETLRRIGASTDDGSQVSKTFVDAGKLNVKNAGEKKANINQDEKITQLERELEEEKAKRRALEAIVDSVRDKCSVLDSHGDILNTQQMEMKEMRENITGIVKDNDELEKRILSIESSLNETTDIRSSVIDFTTSLRSAFRAEKQFVRNQIRGVQNVYNQEIEGMKNDTNTAISELGRDISDLQNNSYEMRKDSEALEELDNRLSSLVTTIDEINSCVAKSHTKLDAYERDLSELSKCCFGKSTIVDTTTLTLESIQPPTSTSNIPVPSLAPVTLQPGGPAILPLYEEELSKAIKIGSRVVRGRDWAWGDQDGTPPGPGTVLGWIKDDPASGEVYVRWDRGTSRANYRVGSSGKYDLYLLPDQTRFEIQPIFGSALEKAIKIGSRVVRGRDWAWHDQDGNPPTPGTVIRWYANDPSSKQVMVQWDSGKTVNYRVGAHGKYDLYLLKGQ